MNFKDNPYFQLHLAIFFWGFTGVLGLAIELPAPLIVGYRMVLTAVFLAVIITAKNKWVRIPRADLLRVYIIGMLFAVHWLAFYMSIKLAGASIAMICLATASVFTALIQPLFRKTALMASEVIIGLLAVAGVLVLYIFQENDPAASVHIKGEFQWGIICGVIAAVISSVFTIFNKPLAEKYESRNIVFHEMVAGFLFLCLLAPLYFEYYHSGRLMLEGWEYIWMFCLVYFCTVLGQQLVIKSLKKLQPFTVTLSVNIEPVYGILLAFMLFNENNMMNWSFYLGVAVIILSLVLQVYITGKRKKALLKK